MKPLSRFLAVLVSAVFLTQQAFAASIVPSIPYNLTNGTLADATQVMGNFNTIVTDVNANAVGAGANSSITSITGLTTPLTPAQGGTAYYAGGTTAGTANAQTLAVTVPSNFGLAAGNLVSAKAGASNSTAATFAVNGTTATAMRVSDSGGLHALVGGEIISGNSYTWYYDGTFYILLNPSTITASNIPSSVALAGNPTTTTQASSDSSTKIATTAYVKSALPSSAQLQKQVITATGAFTFTTPVGSTTSTVYKVTLTAGGGAGGGTASGTGGGGGETIIKWVTGLAASTGYTGSVGTGGTGSAGATGGNGADTTFTDAGPTTYTAHKGTGGATSGDGSAGGSGGNGDLNITGGSGGRGYTSASTDDGGMGGGSFWGPGAPENPNGGAGKAAVSFGGGGSGSTTGAGNTGGAGKSGVAVFEWIL